MYHSVKGVLVFGSAQWLMIRSFEGGIDGVKDHWRNEVIAGGCIVACGSLVVEQQQRS